MKLIKLFFLLFIIILNGCAQSTAFLGPGITLATTGNAFQAGMQYGANTAIKNETGKDALTYVKDAVEQDQKQRKFNKDFIKMVENRVKIAREKILVN